MANLIKTILVVAFVSTTEAIQIEGKPPVDPSIPIDATGVANYCETSKDCGGSVKSGYSCGWYQRHFGAMEGRCIPTRLCGKNALDGEDGSLMVCPDVVA